MFAIVISLRRSRVAAVLRTLPSVHVATRGVIYAAFAEIFGAHVGKDKIVSPHTITSAPNGCNAFSITNINKNINCPQNFLAYTLKIKTDTIETKSSVCKSNVSRTPWRHYVDRTQIQYTMKAINTDPLYTSQCKLCTAVYRDILKTINKDPVQASSFV